MTHRFAAVAGTAALVLTSLAAVPAAAQYRQTIGNDPARCAAGRGPAIAVTVTGIKAATGRIRVQSYRATERDWLEKGRWINRIEAPARKGTMRFCLPVPGPGSYAVAVRHDVNGNGDTDIFSDGGAMSNNPAINIFNLGKPHVRKTAFAVGGEAEAITVAMRYR